MNWIKITNFDLVPLNEKMLFLEGNSWEQGTLVNDSEYGLCVSLFETYRDLKVYSHYMRIVLP